MRILVIEDDLEAAAYVVKGLRESGHIVDHAADGEEGLTLALSGSFDVLIVDRMLPKRDGLSLVSTLRAEGIRVPVLFLSALGEVDDRIMGLKAGGDDYLTKPYAFAELLARIEKNPKDHQARFDLALALNAKGDKEGAVDQLLISFEYDRNWNEQAARKQLVEFFDAYGPKDEVTLSGRRRLSSLMFS
ncbi:tetratricopeptide repeat protein [Aerococcus loyolae]|uniref:Response regulatory domain-containing protein n=1 Tax=Aerococcus urinae TaxID=1376 RepID=A0A329NVJ5_9LACT|nr:hypothetical protein DBT54_09590 [Aerococcus loyolae]